jgi:pimeloyl-ACP methyl ester carboxylesterase
VSGPLELAVSRVGNGPPVVALHGLLGRARNLQGIGRALEARHAVWLADLRNHGASPWSDEMSYAAMAADVAAVIEREAMGPVTLIGHSMGGKVAMTLALTRPELVARLIVVDIAPVRYAQGYERFIRAMQAADLTPPTRRGEVDAQLAASIPDPAMRAFLMQNLATRDGASAWQPNLAVLLRTMPELTGFPEALADRRFAGPTRCLRGAGSDYVDAAGEAALRRHFPDFGLATVPGAGHWPHAEQPEAFQRLLVEAMGS